MNDPPILSSALLSSLAQASWGDAGGGCALGVARWGGYSVRPTLVWAAALSRINSDKVLRLISPPPTNPPSASSFSSPPLVSRLALASVSPRLPRLQQLYLSTPAVI